MTQTLYQCFAVALDSVAFVPYWASLVLLSLSAQETQLLVKNGKIMVLMPEHVTFNSSSTCFLQSFSVQVLTMPTNLESFSLVELLKLSTPLHLLQLPLLL
mmetsp:Transcript_7243/g.22087  ORF Transcript_7243/g.22087 Transcript_7243/m.22087 type:complete len:101 (-) Transcript_7243:30-332(-)